MAIDPDIAFSPGDLMRRVRELEQKVQELVSGRRLENSAVGRGGVRVHRGGGVSVEDGGRLGTVLASGVRPFSVGQLAFGDPPVLYDGIVFRNPTGNAIFFTFPVGGSAENIAWKFTDGQSREVLSMDVLNGGLARPWLPQPGVPVVSTSIPMTTTSSFIAVWSTGFQPKQQPFIQSTALLRSADGGVGEARYTLNGDAVGDTMTISDGTFAWQAFQKLQITGDTYSDFARLELEVRLTNGTGEVGGVFSSYQRQT